MKRVMFRPSSLSGQRSGASVRGDPSVEPLANPKRRWVDFLIKLPFFAKPCSSSSVKEVRVRSSGAEGLRVR